MGMRRGAVKTPGGKLVAVTVQTDQSGLPVACRLDGDFFIDGDGAPLLLDDLERTLLACAREASVGRTGAQDGDGSALPAPAAREHADVQGRAARPEAHDDGARTDAVVDAVDIVNWRDRLLQACAQHDGVRLVGTGAEAMARALSRAMGIGDESAASAVGLNGTVNDAVTKTGMSAGPQLADVPPNDMVADAVAETGPLAGAASYGLCGHRPAPHAGWPSDWLDRWRRLAPVVIHDVPRSPVEQMAIDEQWAREVAAGERPASLRFWEWSSPAVVVGRFQSIPDEVHVDEAERLGFTVVRRCTGGGTMVVQPGGAITYSLYAPRWFVDGLDAAEAYRLCDSWLIDALRGLGVDAQFQGLNDIAVADDTCRGTVDGRDPAQWGKAGGAAQRRFPAPPDSDGPGAVLHHTTLAYELDGALMARLLNTSPDKLSDKAVRSASKRVAPLGMQPPLQGMGRDGLIRALSRSLGQFLSTNS